MNWYLNWGDYFLCMVILCSVDDNDEERVTLAEYVKKNI